MNSIRSSVHDLHDESLDLKLELKKIIGSFTFCHINFEYDLTTSPDNEIKYSFIAIVKEALANVMKHSHATEVEVVVHEHPAFYQLVIKDNDLSHSNMAHTNLSHSGIGLHNMNDRITRLDGQFSIDTTNGFKIFITVPKKKFDSLIPALHAVNKDQNVFGNEIIGKLPKLLSSEVNTASPLSQFDLTPKEISIIEEVANGLNNKEIAEKLFLGEGTVRNYISNILDKLELRDRTQLAIFYYKHRD